MIGGRTHRSRPENTDPRRRDPNRITTETVLVYACDGAVITAQFPRESAMEAIRRNVCYAVSNKAIAYYDSA